MEDFTALAGTLSGSVGDARGALILSKDGLVLGADPADAESLLKPAWLHFASLGEPERGFVQFGTEIWCYVRRGPYAAFVVSGVGVRPGLVIDEMEMVLLAAEQARAKREVLRAEPSAPAPAAAPSGKPRTPLHPEARPSEQPSGVFHAQALPGAASEGGAAGDTPSPAPRGPPAPPALGRVPRPGPARSALRGGRGRAPVPSPAGRPPTDAGGRGAEGPAGSARDLQRGPRDEARADPRRSCGDAIGEPRRRQRMGLDRGRRRGGSRPLLARQGVLPAASGGPGRCRWIARPRAKGRSSA